MVCINVCGHSFNWVLNEDFSELVELGPIPLKDTTAECIEKMNISFHSKILLSAVAGAAFQYLIGNNLPYNLSGLLVITDDTRYISIDVKTEILAKSLRSLRELLGWKSCDLGTKLGLTRQTINNIEHHKTMSKVQYFAIRYLFDNIAVNHSAIYPEFAKEYKKIFKEEII